MSWGTIFCPPIGPSVRNALLVWVKSKGLYGVLLFNLLKITPQIAGDCGFSEITPLWGGIRIHMLFAPEGAKGGVHMPQYIKRLPQNIHPGGAHVGH